MSNLPENGAVCGIDGCGPTARKTHQQEESDETLSPARHELSIVSDIVCPWCFVAKKNLERALGLLPHRRDFSIVWRPYELNPGMPKQGMDRREYRTRKFGSWEHSLALDAQVAQAGQQAGITFRHDLMKRTPNTFNAHRLVWFAQREGAQEAIVEGLFKAYFTEGRDVGDLEVLADLAAVADLDRVKTAVFLASDDGAEEVRREESMAISKGISGVPTFILDGEELFSGARKPDMIAAHLARRSPCNVIP
jgi:predicted DsbA family dithiol-disulfide isomerase